MGRQQHRPRAGASPQPRGGRVGTVAVEFALIAPLLIILLFGIIEFGLVFKDILMIHQAAREGAHAAAVSATPSEITTRILAAAGTLDPTALDVTLDFRTCTAGVWGAWTTLGETGSPAVNNAPRGAQLRVRLDYAHSLVTGALFDFLADDVAGTTVALTSQAVMRRE